MSPADAEEYHDENGDPVNCTFCDVPLTKGGWCPACVGADIVYDRIREEGF